MAITSALVLYAVIWFLVLFISLPIRLTTQGDTGKVVDGTHEAAPANFNLKRKALWVTVIATVIWAVVASVILWGGISVRDLDFFNRMTPLDESSGRDG